MKRNSTIIGFVAVLAIVLGGMITAAPAIACEGAKATKTADASEVTTAKVTQASAKSCGADAKHADAKLTTASGKSCGSKATLTTASGKSCGTDAKHADAKLTTASGKSCGTDAKHAGAKGQCASKGVKTAELMDGEATLAKLSHCGIDVNAASTEKLAAKLANGDCGSYSAEQWATMIDAAKELDSETSEAVLASVKSDKVCTSDQCPMSLVAKDLAATDTKKN